MSFRFPVFRFQSGWVSGLVGIAASFALLACGGDRADAPGVEDVEARPGTMVGPDSARMAGDAVGDTGYIAARPGQAGGSADSRRTGADGGAVGAGAGSSPGASAQPGRDGASSAGTGSAGPPIDFDALPPVTDADFRVAVEPVDPDERVRRPRHVRGIYVNAWSAGSDRRRAALLRLADTTEINAFVVDVKDVSGQVSYRSTVPMVAKLGANREIRIDDIRQVLAELKEHGVYPIARIVAFKDPVVARSRPDWAVQTADGRVFRDHNDEVWVDAYNEDVWRYNLALAREAVALGFAEVQWDYIRFPDVPWRYMQHAVYPAREGRTRTDAIRAFMKLSRDSLHAEFDVPVTADVFGVTTSAGNDVGIGQQWELMADVMDVLLPMVYPSHYPRGSFGIAHPNADPYATLMKALGYGVRRSKKIEDAALIRPWIQDFSMGRPAYGPEYVRAQIRAVYDSGLDEWILWNPGSRYTEEALADRRGNEPHLPGLAALLDPDEPKGPDVPDVPEEPTEEEDELLGRPVTPDTAEGHRM